MSDFYRKATLRDRLAWEAGNLDLEQLLVVPVDGPVYRIDPDPLADGVNVAVNPQGQIFGVLVEIGGDDGV